MLSKWKSKSVVRGLSVLAISALTVSGCSGKKDDGSYDMRTASIFADGCLNVGNLYASLHAMPGDGIVRSFTYDFSASAKDQDGNSPSSARLRILTRGAYVFSEGRPSELQNTWTSANQQGCSTGQLFDMYGNATPFTVEEYKDTWIKVKLPDDSTQRFDLTSERSLRIVANEFRGSQCISHAPIRIETETVLRWGPAAELPEGEIVSSRYMRELTQSVSEAPAALQASVSEVTTDSMSLAASLLREMNEMTVKAQDLRECPVSTKPPSMPELPTPTPSPTPEATPIPEATPVAVPEATPAPEPTPEI